MPWTQVYNPTGSEWLSTLWPLRRSLSCSVRSAILGWPAPRAAAAGLVTALAVAIGVFGMPWQAAVAAAGYGACFGLFPIGWIVLAAVFLYVLTVDAGRVRESQSFGRGVVARSPDSGALDCVLLRGVYRGGGRIRDAGGHLGGAA